MMLQSFQGTVARLRELAERLGRKFGSLRAYGRVPGGSSAHSGRCDPVHSHRERARGPVHAGQSVAGKALVVYRNGVDAGALDGTDVMFPTSKGEVVTLVPDGTTYADVMSRL